MAGNLAIIPVRTGSKRLSGKNTNDFFGKPLFVFTIECARESGLFDEIHVSTESKEVADQCREFNVEPLFLRPSELASDSAKLNDVCAHVLDEFSDRDRPFDTFCLLWATAPLRTAEDVKAAYQMMDDETDAVVGVTDYDLPVYCAQNIDSEQNLSPMFPDMMMVRSQEMQAVVCDNGSLCWVRTDAFREHKTWMPPRLKGFHMPRSRSVDIDNVEDWERAEYLYAKALGKKLTR